MKTNLHTASTYNTNRSLENIIWVSAITLLIILFSYNNSQGNPMNFEDEAYIDDIPFDTEMVVSNMVISEFDFADESFIDDIPFSTHFVVLDLNFENNYSTPFSIEEETYINDIPFNTEDVVEYYTTNTKEFQFEDESYIEDIPFDTYTIAQKTIHNLKTDLCVLR